MTTTEWIVAVSGAVAIAAINWFFFLSPKAGIRGRR